MLIKDTNLPRPKNGEKDLTVKYSFSPRSNFKPYFACSIISHLTYLIIILFKSAQNHIMAKNTFLPLKFDIFTF